MNWLRSQWTTARECLTPARLFWLFLGSLVQAFGLCNIHAWSGVTEGGVLGATLLLQHWIGISPAVSSLVLNAVCFITGWRMLGGSFLACSIVACGSYAMFYALLEPFAPLIPALIGARWIAALTGACFIGIGAGLGMRAGGAISGDDALAMALSYKLHVGVQRIYLISDLTVLVLSLTYIVPKEILWSLVTVILSGQIIGLIQKISLPGIE